VAQEEVAGSSPVGHPQPDPRVPVLITILIPQANYEGSGHNTPWVATTFRPPSLALRQRPEGVVLRGDRHQSVHVGHFSRQQGQLLGRLPYFHGGQPWLLLTGDSLFVGDLARPDLVVEPEEGARDLFGSLRKLLELEDFVEVRPAHIGGSLCGGADMSRKPDSTIGFERRFNGYLRIEDESEFVRTLTAEQTPQPPNFERIVELNRGPLITEAAPLEPLLPERVRELVESGAVLIDGRDQREFDAIHVPGSINVTMNQSGVGTRAAWVVEPESEVLTTADGDEDARRMIRMLEAVGFRHIRGYLAGGLNAWRGVNLAVETIPSLGVPSLAKRLREKEVVLLDVRSTQEWEAGHVEGSIHVPYQRLREGMPEEIRNVAAPLAVACSGGIRSALAASLLKRAGVRNVEHVADGGVPDLEEEGIDLVPEG
jgi:hydroxyacylglutathione hydrolase